MAILPGVERLMGGGSARVERLSGRLASSMQLARVPTQW